MGRMERCGKEPNNEWGRLYIASLGVLAPYRSYKVSKRGRERGCRYDTGLKEMRRKKMRRKKMY